MPEELNARHPRIFTQMDDRWMVANRQMIFVGALVGAFLIYKIASSSYISWFIFRWFCYFMLLTFLLRVPARKFYDEVWHLFLDGLLYRWKWAFPYQFPETYYVGPLLVGFLIGIFSSIILKYEYDLLSYKFQPHPMPHINRKYLEAFCNSVNRTRNL